MEQLTTYTLKSKTAGFIFLFKYDLIGNLKLFEITEGVLNPKQIKWLFSPRFPASEIMIKEWQTDEEYMKLFDVELSPADVSFNALWNLYDYKVSRMDAEKQFKKLKAAEVIKCFVEIPFYIEHLKKNPGIAKLHLSTYISKRRFEDERPQVAMKVGKVFNPILKDLAASKKTNK